MYLWSELYLRTLRIHNLRDFPVRPGVKNPPCNAGNVSLIPGQGTSGSAGKESACNAVGLQKHRFNPWVRKAPWRKKWQPTPVFLPGKPHGQRSLVGYIVHRVAKSQIQLKLLNAHRLLIQLDK